MSEREPLVAEASALSALANGIIPADERDAGAASVQAGSLLAIKLTSGVNATLYRTGLAAADSVARTRFRLPLTVLDPSQMQQLLETLRDQHGAFFRQLRADVCALYLSDPELWARIGFPGPSSEQGGYPDFDQPQSPRPVRE